MAKLTVRDLDAKGKEVLMRVDFNVPLKDGEITNDARIVAALPTIKFLLDQGARLVLTSHLGRPKNEPDPAFSLKPVAARLSELLGKDVKFVPAAIGPEAEASRAAMKDGDVVLLENVRFYPGEKKNDPEFAKSLLGNATLFVNDAFGTAHRAHASTEGVTHFAEKSAMGFLIERELEYLEGKLENPEKPFVVIMGGAKVSDKIEVLSKLMEKADTFLIGGAMANTFLAAEGYDLGASKIEGDKLDLAREILAAAKAKGV
ncbi:MAG: phosphoglycerate kinase, partial [Akkermansia sp.]|nr:phosphoglycerate kinase [Akkermansia sp.]